MRSKRMECVRIKGRGLDASGGRQGYFYGYMVDGDRVSLFVDSGEWSRAFYECKEARDMPDAGEDKGFLVSAATRDELAFGCNSLRKHMKKAGARRADKDPATNLDLESSGSGEEWGCGWR